MTDLDIYRARIGLYNLRNCGGNKSNINENCSRDMSFLLRRIILVLVLGSICLCMTLEMDVSSEAWRESLRLSHLLPGRQRETIEVWYLWPSTLMGQNYQLKARDWNSYMKAMNGNKTCLDVAHWNGGSSHLGKLSKGREKLLHAKFLLSKYNLDVLGLS